MVHSSIVKAAKPKVSDINLMSFKNFSEVFGGLVVRCMLEDFLQCKYLSAASCVLTTRREVQLLVVLAFWRQHPLQLKMVL
jgi:hypothetical protein